MAVRPALAGRRLSVVEAFLLAGAEVARGRRSRIEQNFHCASAEAARATIGNAVGSGIVRRGNGHARKPDRITLARAPVSATAA